MMSVLIGCDHRGRDAAAFLLDRLTSAGVAASLLEEGVSGGTGTTDYPVPAFEVSRRVGSGEVDRGILICGTGIGMSIAANKVPGVRAAAVHDEITAELSRAHLDANVCCLSADLLGLRLIEKIVERFLDAGFEGGRHERRLRRVCAIEEGRHPADVDGPVGGDEPPTLY